MTATADSRDNPDNGNRYDNSAAVVIPDFEQSTVAAREKPWSEIVDTTCAVLTKAGNRIDQLIARVDALYAERNNLRSIVIEMLSADDAMAAFLIAADPAALGEGEWDRQHKERAARRREAAEAARAAIAKAEGR